MLFCRLCYCLMRTLVLPVMTFIYDKCPLKEGGLDCKVAI